MPFIDDYVIDVLMRDLSGHDRKPASFLVYLWLAAEQIRRKGEVQISYQELAESVGVSKSSAQAAVTWLIRRKLLVSRKENATATPRYIVCTPWRDTDRRLLAETRSQTAVRKLRGKAQWDGDLNQSRRSRIQE